MRNLTHLNDSESVCSPRVIQKCFREGLQFASLGHAQRELTFDKTEFKLLRTNIFQSAIPFLELLDQAQRRLTLIFFEAVCYLSEAAKCSQCFCYL